MDQLLTDAARLLPEGWSPEILWVVIGAALAVLMLPLLLFTRRRPAKKAAPAPPKQKPEALRLVETAGDSAVGPELNPDEWVAGDVIHIDRERAFGLIRCDRLKAPVRFEIPALPKGREPALRIGETVRFKGRHGARRRPVADIVEPVRARRAG